MSTAASHAPVTARFERLRALAVPDIIALSGVGLYVAALIALTWRTWGDLDSDTGYDLVASSRLADGEIPYRDFVYYYGPLAPALGAAIQLLGVSPFDAAIGIGMVVTLAILAATYALARSFVSPVGASLATALTAAVAFIPNNYSFVLPHTANATLGLFCILALLLALDRYAGTASPKLLAVAGVVVGLSLLTKPEPAAAAVVAALAWLLLRRRSLSRREASLVVGPALAIPLLVYIPLAFAAGTHRLLLENLYPVETLKAGGDVLVRVRVPLTVSSVVELVGHLVLYAVGAFVLVVGSRLLTAKGRVRTFAYTAAVGALVVAAAGSLVRPEALRHGLQFVYAWVPAGVLVALAVVLLRRRSAGAGSERERTIVGLAALAVLAGTSYGAFYLHAPHPQMAVYATPLVAIFLARLHLNVLARNAAAVTVGAVWLAFLVAAGTGLALKDARIESVVVRGPAGALAETPEEAALYQSALGWITRTTRPDEQIFVAPLLTGLYSLSGRTSPLPEISILPGALPSSTDERRAITTLDKAQVRLIVTDDRQWPGYGHTSFGGSFDRDLSDWIVRHYELAATLRAAAHPSFEGEHAARTMSIWLRRTQ